MVYSNRFVAVVKCNDKVLRENGDIVTLPFGSDYSLLLKNLESRRASVNVHIDGRDVLYGSSLIIEPNSEMELKGFLQGSVVKNKFRFIQKTQQIQEHRGDKIDDGIIRIEFAFEKRKPIKIETHTYHQNHHTWDVYYHSQPIYGSSIIGSSNIRGIQDNNITACYNVNSSLTSDQQILHESQPLQDEGITVEGEKTRQDFVYASIGTLDPSETIILRLKGTTQIGNKVRRPLTVKTKIECKYCGTQSKSNMRFCGGCGAALDI